MTASQDQGSAQKTPAARKRSSATQAARRASKAEDTEATVAAAVDAPAATEVTEEGAASERAESTEHAGRPGLPLPFVSTRVPLPRVRVPRVPRPSQHTVIVGALRVTDAVRDNMPPREDLVYYGGLGALAIFGVVEWPVAAAIGAGVWLAERRRGRGDKASAPQASADTTTASAREPEHATA